MKSSILSFIVLASVFAFTSCDTKKLAASQADNQKLTSDLTSCNSNMASAATAANGKISDLNNQIATLTAQNAALAPDAMAYKQLKADLKAQRDQLNLALAEQGTSLREIR